MASNERLKGPSRKTFQCKLAGILNSSINIGQKSECTPNQPKYLKATDAKLHYVMHYIDSGVWDYVIPKETEEVFPDITGYTCNLCSSNFLNSYKTKSTSGRCLALSHLADTHGLLLRTLKLEQRLDLKKDVEDIISCIEAFNKMVKEMSDLDNLDPKEWISVNRGSGLPQHCPTDVNVSNEKGVVINDPLEKPSEPTIASKEVPLKTDLTDTVSSIENIKESSEKRITEIETSKKPSVIECPHCDEFKGNDSGSFLRLHIYTHYLQHWEQEMSKVKENFLTCHLCNKKITGQNLEGAKRAVACHFAVQHFQLRKILENEPGLPENFVSDLYWDFDEQMKHVNALVFSGKSISSSKRRYSQKNFSYQSSDDSDSSGKVKKGRKKIKGKSSTKAVVQPGESNPNYVRKRAKINFSLDDESEASDNSWDDSKIAGKVLPSSSKVRVMPKRSATKSTKVWSFLDDSEDDEL